MRKAKKWGIAFVVLALLVTIFTGCGSSGNNATKDSSSSSADNKNETSGGEKIELTYWDASWNQQIAPEVIKEFEAKNPNIKINVEFFPIDGMNDKYLLALKNKSGPDLIDIAADWTTPYAAVGGLLALDDYIAKDKVDMNDFWPGALKTIRVNGKVYALPYRSETHGLFYNKALFQKAGLDPAKAPQNWDELLADAQAISKSGDIAFGLVGKLSGDLSYQLINFIRSFGGDVLSEDNKKALFDQPEAIAAVKYYVDLYRNKLAPDSALSNTNTDSRNLFASGKVGMFLSGNYDIDPIKQANANLDFGTAMYPQAVGKERKLTLGGWNIAATSFTKHPEAAWKFVNFIASPEISAKYSNTFSSRKSAMSNPKYQDPLVQPFTKMLEYGEPMPSVPQISQIRDILNNHVQQALLGQVSVEDAMKAAAKEVNALLQ